MLEEDDPCQFTPEYGSELESAASAPSIWINVLIGIDEIPWIL